MRSIQRAALRGLQPLYLVACSSRAIASTVTPATAWRISLSKTALPETAPRAVRRDFEVQATAVGQGHTHLVGWAGRVAADGVGKRHGGTNEDPAPPFCSCSPVFLGFQRVLGSCGTFWNGLAPRRGSNDRRKTAPVLDSAAASGQLVSPDCPRLESCLLLVDSNSPVSGYWTAPGRLALRRQSPVGGPRRALPVLVQTGILQAALAFACWGVFPLYFKTLEAVPPLEMMAHRIVWSFGFVALLLAAQRRWAWLAPALANRRLLAGCAASAALIALNWFLYIWAVVNGHIVEASLGYFINPLVNVLLGALVLKERLRRGQWLAVAVAALGVAWLTWQAGALPWIALALAASFGLYGLLRKTAPLGALEGLAMETLLLGPLAALGLLWLALQGQSQFVQGSPGLQALVVAAGPITAIPLLLFASGARRIPLSLLGILQYIGPTLQLMVGVWLFHEPFEPERRLGFMAIWAALALYSAEGWWRQRRAASG